MSTIINNPSDRSEGGAGLGLLVGVIIAAFAVLLFFVYGIPGLSRTEPGPAIPDNTTEVDIQVPTPDIGSPDPAPADTTPD